MSRFYLLKSMHQVHLRLLRGIVWSAIMSLSMLRADIASSKVYNTTSLKECGSRAALTLTPEPKGEIIQIPLKLIAEVRRYEDHLLIIFPSIAKIYVKKNGDYKIKCLGQWLIKDEYSSLPVIKVLAERFIPAPSYKKKRTSISKFNQEIKGVAYGIRYNFEKLYISENTIFLYFKILSRSSEDLGRIVAKFKPASFMINGKRWIGFGESFAVLKNTKPIVSLNSMTVWNLGDSISSHKTWINSPYGKNRGFSEYQLTPKWLGRDIKLKNIFFAGQPFCVFVDGDTSHITFVEEPMVINFVIKRLPRNYHIVTEYKYGIAGRIKFTPLTYHLFLPERINNKYYSELSSVINHYIRTLAGIPYLNYCPIAGASRGSQIKFVSTKSSWSKFADKVLDVAHQMEFKRIFVGWPYDKQKYNFEFGDKKRTYSAIKSFCEKAHSKGLEVIFWIETCTSAVDSFLVSDHPEWVVIQGSGSAPHYASHKNLILINPSNNYLDWLHMRLRDLQVKTNFDGVWLDSFELATRILQFTEGTPKYHVDALLGFVKNLFYKGLSVYAEAFSPFIYSSFWFRKNRFKSYRGSEYALTETSPYTNRPDSDFVNYFEAASYKCFPIIDIHPFVDKKNVYKKQQAFFELIKRSNGAVNLINNRIGAKSELFIFSAGTYWVNEKGYAVFVHEKLDGLTLPIQENQIFEFFYCSPGGEDIPIQEWKVRDGRLMVKGVPKYTVILVSRKENPDITQSQINRDHKRTR